MPLNVLLLIDSLRMGGAERITVSLLPHLDRERLNPILCTLHKRRQSPLADQVSGIKVVNLAARRMLDPMALWRLVQLVRDEKIDVIHAQLQDATIFAALAGKICGVPVVVTRHLIGDRAHNRRRRLRNQLERKMIRWNVTKVISVSDAARDAYAEIVGLPLTRFETIYNGIDVERFLVDEDKRVLREQLNFPVDAPLVVMVGVMREGKGHDVCIDAARQLPDVHFLLVGDGKAPFRAELERQAAGVATIHFLGQRMDVPQILAASDILILPSYSEALPTVLIEAGAAGLPVVATNVGGMPEIVEDGETGFIIPPGNAALLAQQIRWLIDHPAQMQQFGKKAREVISQKFTLSRQADDLAAFYEKIATLK